MRPQRDPTGAVALREAVDNETGLRAQFTYSFALVPSTAIRILPELPPPGD